jgi:DNA-binding CsgD family transcriptional regulator
MKYRISYIIIILLTYTISHAQVFSKKGVPQIKNFNPASYLNKGKVWDIDISENGMVYMAADRGLLEYDGVKWNCYKGSKGVVRSLLVASDSVIYTGSDLDFGVWKKQSKGEINYTSLYPFKDDVQDIIEEFWNLYKLDDLIIFVSSKNIYILKNNQITKFSSENDITSSFVYNDTLYFSLKNGLYYFDKLSFKPDIEYFNNKISIIGMYNADNKVICVSKSNGLFVVNANHLQPLNNSLSKMLSKTKVFSFNTIGDSYLAFGTILNGVVISDKKANIIHILNKSKGLYSNTALSMAYSKSGKLWIGLDYGISTILLNNKYTYFYDYQGNFGTGADALLIGENFYLGTNQGLYVTNWNALNDNNSSIDFKLIPKTEGQVWSLLNYDNQLFVAHDHGVFTYNNNNLKQIYSQSGVLSLLNKGSSLLAGTYNGITVLSKEAGKWTFKKHLELISGSCKQLLLQNDNLLWINIPNYGIIKAELDDALNIVNRKIYSLDLFDGIDVEISKENNSIKLIFETNVYNYISEEDRFILNPNESNNPLPDNILDGVYRPKNIDSTYAFYPVYNGFAFQYLPSIENSEYDLNKLIIRFATAYDNAHQQVLQNGSSIPNRLNNIKIEFVIPNLDGVLYQYRFSKDDPWSEWTTDNTLVKVGMKYGDYDFQIRAKSGGVITEPIDFFFTIDKPWSLSWQAFIVYFLIFILLVTLSRIRYVYVLKKEKQKMFINKQKSMQNLEDRHKKELIRIEQERIKEEYELVKSQLKAKTVELANKSKENEDKNRLLLSIQDKFIEMQKRPSNSKVVLSEIKRLLNSYINIEDKTFEIQMDELHQEFFRKIKEAYPKLSNNDLRLCAYIKVGLNAKEIAEILNIQPSSSYINRSRLRKKLNLKTEDDLYSFLNKF